MTTASSPDRYFPSLVSAVRSITGLDSDCSDFWRVYNLIYPHLPDMPGAVQTGKNCHWKVPASGLRLLGYRPTHDHTRPLAEILDEERRAEHKLNPEPEPEIAPAPEETPTRDTSVSDALALISREIGRLTADNARLEAERDAARDRADVAEAHLRDLRSLLDYSTAPTQDR